MTKLAIALIGYYVTHSLLASESVKSFFHKFLAAERYRLLYSLFSVVLLVFPVYYYFQANNVLLLDTGLVGRFILLTFALLAFKVGVISFRRVSLSQFLGLRPGTGERLVVSGMYQFVRHPLYFALMLFLTGWCVAIPEYRNLLVFLLTIAYISIGYRLEEKRLLRQFSEEYRSYKGAVPALFPVCWKGFLKYVLSD